MFFTYLDQVMSPGVDYHLTISKTIITPSTNMIAAPDSSFDLLNSRFFTDTRIAPFQFFNARDRLIYVNRNLCGLGG